MTTGLIIAAPSSGSGKTSVTLGLLRHLARSGLEVSSLKIGPDYIDPAFHAAASGRVCRNLDLWAMRPETAQSVAARACAGAGAVIVEGVMGLFDGANAASGRSGSTAEAAAMLGWPVVLVVDARGMGASVAALVKGFAELRSDVDLRGVIFNRVGSLHHREILSRAMQTHCPRIKIFGFLPRCEDLALPSRHLGLVQAGEQANLQDFLDKAADFVAEHLDIAGLLALGPIAVPKGQAAAILPPLGQTIAIAQDQAFAFSYPALLEGWRAQGAELAFFSPLADEAPGDCDAVYLPGGYPELWAGKLAGNAAFLDGLRAAAGRGAAVYGECGGFMVLGESLVDESGAEHAMAGLLPLRTSFAQRKLHLGYRQAVLAADCALGRQCDALRSHEFHYSSILAEGQAERLFSVADAAGRDLGPAGLIRNSVFGSFLHIIDRV